MRANPDAGRRLMAMVRELRASMWSSAILSDGDPYEAGHRRARVDSACDAMTLAAMALGHDITEGDDLEPNSAEAAQEACNRG